MLYHTVVFNVRAFVVPISNYVWLIQVLLYQISLEIKGCPNTKVSTSATGTTGYGVPDPVTNAYVNQTENQDQCLIVWNHSLANLNIKSYQVKIFTCLYLEVKVFTIK